MGQTWLDRTAVLAAPFFLTKFFKGNSVHHRAQYDDKIRNLLELARDDSPQARTLLFSHICDLFVQHRPMQSEKQIRMLLDILRELLPSVELKARKDIVSVLINMDDPPVDLIKIFSEDVAEVSGPLLEQAIIPDDHLIHLVRYGNDQHRYFISRRFGLSPLVRHELDRHHHGQTAPRLKFSLSELAERDSLNRPSLDEEATASLFNLIKSQRHHKKRHYPASHNKTDRNNREHREDRGNAFEASLPSSSGKASQATPLPSETPSSVETQASRKKLSMAELSRAIFDLEEEQRLAAAYGNAQSTAAQSTAALRGAPSLPFS